MQVEKFQDKRFANKGEFGFPILDVVGIVRIITNSLIQVLQISRIELAVSVLAT